MWKLRKSEECALFVDAVEGAGTETTMADALVDRLEPSARKHMSSCADCTAYFADLLTTRGILRSGYPLAANLDAPWFAARVMARISAEERAVSMQEAVWNILPKLASRVAGIAALALVLAGGFLIKHTAGNALSSGTTESLFDTSQAQISHEDILGSVSEKVR